MVSDAEFTRPAEVDAQAATAVIAAMSSTERGRSFAVAPASGRDFLRAR